MIKKIIICSLFFTISQIIGGELQKALPCSLSHDKPTPIEQREKREHQKQRLWQNHGLSYNQEQERGIIWQIGGGKIRQRLIITKEQSATILEQLDTGRRHKLESPLYITVTTVSGCLDCYQITSFEELHLSRKKSQISPFAAATYQSDEETESASDSDYEFTTENFNKMKEELKKYRNGKEERISDTKLLFGVAIGAIGITVVWLAIMFSPAYFFIKNAHSIK